MRKKWKGFLIVEIILVLCIIGMMIFGYKTLQEIGGSTRADLTEDLIALEGDIYQEVHKSIQTVEGQEIEILETKTISIVKTGQEKWNDTMPTQDHDGVSLTPSKYISLYDCSVITCRYACVNGNEISDSKTTQATHYTAYEANGENNEAKAVVDSKSKSISYSDDEIYFDDYAAQAQKAYQKFSSQKKKSNSDSAPETTSTLTETVTPEEPIAPSVETSTSEETTTSPETTTSSENVTSSEMIVSPNIAQPTTESSETTAAVENKLFKFFH